MLSNLTWPILLWTQVVSHHFPSVQGIPHISREHSSFLAISKLSSASTSSRKASLTSTPSLPVDLSPCPSHPHLCHGSYQLCYNWLLIIPCHPSAWEPCEGQDCAVVLVLILSPAFSTVPSKYKQSTEISLSLATQMFLTITCPKRRTVRAPTTVWIGKGKCKSEEHNWKPHFKGGQASEWRMKKKLIKRKASSHLSTKC